MTLVRFLGIYGVALGTMIPSLLIHLIVWPGYISRMVGVNRWQIVGSIWGAVLLAAVPFALVSYLVDRSLPVHSIIGFFMQTLLLLTVFAAMLLLLFRQGFRTYVLPVLRSRLRGRSTVAA